MTDVKPGDLLTVVELAKSGSAQVTTHNHDSLFCLGQHDTQVGDR